MCANGPLKQEENQKAICTIYSELQLMIDVTCPLYPSHTNLYTVHSLCFHLYAPQPLYAGSLGNF